jgi:transposase
MAKPPPGCRTASAQASHSLVIRPGSCGEDSAMARCVVKPNAEVHYRDRHARRAPGARHTAADPAALPPLVQLRTTLLAEQFALLGTQGKRLAAELNPLLVPTPDVQRLLWIPGIGRIVAFTMLLEVDGIARFPSARDFVSYCRLVPGAGNSGGKTRHKRTKDGNRYLKLAFSHAAVRAIQYYPEIQRFYRTMARRKPRIVARALVAKELARIVYYVLTTPEAFHGTFKGITLSRTKTPQWPRLARPSV